MANTKSALKEIRKSKKRYAKNKVVKEELKTLIKDCRKAIEAGGTKTKELLAKTLKEIDKAVQKGVIKKNTGSRKKSRLQSFFNKFQKKDK